MPSIACQEPKVSALPWREAYSCCRSLCSSVPVKKTPIPLKADPFPPSFGRPNGFPPTAWAATLRRFPARPRPHSVWIAKYLFYFVTILSEYSILAYMQVLWSQGVPLKKSSSVLDNRGNKANPRGAGRGRQQGNYRAAKPERLFTDWTSDHAGDHGRWTAGDGRNANYLDQRQLFQ